MDKNTKQNSINHILNEDNSICANALLYSENPKCFKERILIELDASMLETYFKILSIKIKKDIVMFKPLLSLQNVLLMIHRVKIEDSVVFNKILDVLLLTLYLCSIKDIEVLMKFHVNALLERTEKYYNTMYVLLKSLLDKDFVNYKHEKALFQHIYFLTSELKHNNGKVYKISVESLKLLMSKEILDPFEYLPKILHEIKIISMEKFDSILCDFIDHLLPVKSDAFQKVQQLLAYLNLLQTIECSARKVTKPDMAEDGWLFLLKKLVEYFKRINSVSELELMLWNPLKIQELSEAWDAFFIIIEQLKDNQQEVLSNIDHFRKLRPLNQRWIICLLERGLQNSNCLVQTWCVNYILKNRDLWRFLGHGSDSYFTSAINKESLFSTNNLHLEMFYDFVKAKPEFIQIECLQKTISIYHTSMALMEMIEKKHYDREIKKNEGDLVMNCLNKIINALSLCSNILIRTVLIDRVIKTIFDKQLFEYLYQLPNISILKPNSGTIEKLKGPYIVSFVLLKNLYNSHLHIELKRLFSSLTFKFHDFLNAPLLFVNAFKSHKDLDQEKVTNCCKQILSTFIESMNLDNVSEIQTSSIEELIQYSGEQFLTNVEQLNKLCVLKVTNPNTTIQIKSEAAIVLKAISQNPILMLNHAIKVPHMFLVSSLQMLIQNHGCHNVDGCGELYSKFYQCLSLIRSNVLKGFSKEEVKPVEELDLTLNLLDMGGTRVLAAEMNVIQLVLMLHLCKEIDASTDLYTKSYSVVERCYIELLNYKGSEYFWECLESFMNMLLAPKLINHVWSCNVIMPYCQKLLEASSVPHGMANVIFSKLFELSPEMLMETTGFMDIYITGLLFGGNCTSENKFEIDLCRKINESHPEIITRNRYNLDAEVRALCFSMMIIICCTSVDQSLVVNNLLEILLIKFYEDISNCYHMGSKTHLMKLRCCQAIAILPKYLCDKKQKDDVASRLEKAIFYENHQLNVLYILETTFARCASTEYIQEKLLTREFLNTLRKQGLQSLFMIVTYHCCWGYNKNETTFVVKAIETILGYTMGQNFITRIYAQLTIRKLIEYSLVEGMKDMEGSCTLKFMQNCVEKYFSIKKDRTSEKYLSDFRFILANKLLRISDILHHIPRITGMNCDELIDANMLLSCFRIAGFENIEYCELNDGILDNVSVIDKLNGIDQDVELVVIEEVEEIVPESSTSGDNQVIQYINDQWSPNNPNGRRYYTIEQLLELRKADLTKTIPKIQSNILAQISNLAYQEPIPHRSCCDKHSNPKIYRQPHAKHQERLDAVRKCIAIFIELSKFKDQQIQDKKLPEDDLQQLNENFQNSLEKLTSNNFDVLLLEIKGYKVIKNEHIYACVNLIFEKVISEPKHSMTYAKLCKKYVTTWVHGEACSQKHQFRDCLIDQCQIQFEKIYKIKPSNNLTDLLKADMDQVKKQELKEKYDEDYYFHRKRAIGTVSFIGELYKIGILTIQIMYMCINLLLERYSLDSNYLEYLCVLLKKVGRKMEGEKKDCVSQCFFRMQEIVNDDFNLSSRLRLMIQDLIEARSNRLLLNRQSDKAKILLKNVKDEVVIEQSNSSKEIQENCVKGRNKKCDKRDMGDVKISHEPTKYISVRGNFNLLGNPEHDSNKQNLNDLQSGDEGLDQ